MMDCDELQTPLLDAQMALSKLHLCGLVWEAWTDFGSVGVGRRAALGKSDRFSQVSSFVPFAPENPNLKSNDKCIAARSHTAHTLRDL